MARPADLVVLAVLWTAALALSVVVLIREIRRTLRLQVLAGDELVWTEHRERPAPCICGPCRRMHDRLIARHVQRTTEGVR